MNTKPNLEMLTDEQNMWLSQLSYLDINELGRLKIQSIGIKISDLKNFIDNPMEPFNGNAGIGNDNFSKVIDTTIGGDVYPTKEGVIECLINCGLGDLTITNISLDQKVTSSGFQAMTFKDSFGNTGISYRGSDFDFSRGAARDWLESDVLEYFKNDSTQRKEALKYFDENKNALGNNYLYGHSLGGNLTSHVFVENHTEIKHAFTINGNPINQQLIDTPEKEAAFNDPNKYSCNIVCGDIVSQFKNCKKYENNINYIKNNEIMKPSALSAHTVQASSFDENGNFILSDRKDQVQKMGFFTTTFMNFVQYIREFMNEISNTIDKNNTKGRENFENYKNDLYNSFDTTINEINYNSNQNTNEEIINKFHDVISKVEQEEIENLKKQFTSYDKLNQNKDVDNYTDEIQSHVK